MRAARLGAGWRRLAMLKRVLVILGGAILLLAGAGVAWIGPRNIIGMMRYDQRREGDLKVGDRAPGVTLTGLDGKTAVRLGEHVGPRPLVLVFGSYT